MVFRIRLLVFFYLAPFLSTQRTKISFHFICWMKISIQIKHRKSNWLTYVMYQYEQNSHKIAIIIHATSWGKGGGVWNVSLLSFLALLNRGPNGHMHYKKVISTYVPFNTVTCQRMTVNISQVFWNSIKLKEEVENDWLTNVEQLFLFGLPTSQYYYYFYVYFCL